MNIAAPTPRPNPRRPLIAPPPPSPARRLMRLTPVFLLGTALTLTPFFPEPADAGAGAAGGRPPEEAVVLPVTLPAPSAGSTVLSLPWGEGPGEVGLADPEGGERRGPEAFAVAPDGRIAVLDSVNRRLLVVEPPGVSTGSIPLELRSPRFLAVTAEQIHVLDADDDRLLQSFTWDGHLVATRTLDESEGPVTALLVDADGSPLVELAHDRTVAVGAPGDTRDLSSAAADRRGRPVAAGSNRLRRVSAGIGSDGHPRVEQRDLGRGLERSWNIDPGAHGAVDHLVSLDSDANGRVVLGMRLGDLPAGRQGAPGSLLLTLLDDESGSLLLAESLYAYLGQPYIVGGDGRVYAPVADPDGYRIVVHGFPEVTR